MGIYFFSLTFAVGSKEIFTKNVKRARKKSGIYRPRSIATKFSYHESKTSTLISSINPHLSLPLFISTPSLNNSRPILHRTALPEMTQLLKLEQTYHGMVLSLLKMAGDNAKGKVKQADLLGADKEARLAKELSVEVATHVQQLGDTIDKNQQELDGELKEQKKHITSDDLHQGFDSKVGRFFVCL